MDLSTLTNEELLSEYDAAACLYITRDPEPLRAEILRRMGPKADPEAPTLIPPRDPFAPEAFEQTVRDPMATLDEEADAARERRKAARQEERRNSRYDR